MKNQETTQSKARNDEVGRKWNIISGGMVQTSKHFLTVKEID